MNIIDLRLSSVDIARLIAEYRDMIVGAYVANVYKHGDAFFFKLRNVSGKRFLVIEPGVRFNLTNQVYEWEHSDVIRRLRAEIRNRRIIDIRQHGFDRIVIIDLSDGYSVICEFMPRGVLCLVRDGVILIASRFVHMKDRSIMPKTKYVFPPNPPPDIWKLSYEKFRARIMSTPSIQRGLMSLGLGLKYSTEVCCRTEINCEASPVNLSEEQLRQIYCCLRDLLSKIMASQRAFVYFDPKGPILFSPIELCIAKNYKYREFPNLDDAIDYFFSNIMVDAKKRLQLEELEEKKHELLEIIKHQEDTIRSIERKIARLKRSVEEIYENYRIIEKILSSIRRAKDEHKMSWEEIRSRINEGNKRNIKGVGIIDSIQTDGTIILKLGNIRISVNYRDTINEITRKILEKIKKLEKKLAGARKALEETKNKLDHIDHEIEKVYREKTYVIVEPRREWYHGFRWFITTNGFLVVAGKDAQTNDALLRKYLEPSDIILHVDIPGGAVVLIKNALNRVKEQDLIEAMTYAAAYSKAWNIGYSAVDVFIAKPQDISLHPPSKTYLKKGSFIVHKKKIIKNVPLEICIGLKLHLDENNVYAQLVSGPRNRISAISDIYVVLRPGKIDKNAVTKRIYQIFVDWLQKRLNGQIARKIIKIEKLTELIPGPSEIVEMKAEEKCQ